MTIPTFRPEIEAYEPSLVKASERASAFAVACCERTKPEDPADAPFDAAVALARHGGRMDWLTLSGVNGCGKTMLARQLFAYVGRNYPHATGPRIAGHGFLSSRRPEVVWIDEVRFVQRCKQGEYDLPEYLRDDWLVVLDDLGASRDKSGFAGEMLFRLCNARIAKFTLFTTNLDLAQVSAQIDPRIASRLIRDGNSFTRIAAGDYAARELRKGAA